MMREEKTKSPSQKKKQSWLLPTIYGGIAIVFVGMIWGYSALVKNDKPEVANEAIGTEENGELVVETNAPEEVLKYPFSEELLDNVNILQSYYDLEAEENVRENSLLVFNQTYEMNTGISISIEDQAFEVLAARSGVVEEVIADTFQGDEIVISHADGMTTVYSSLTSVQVKKGDEVAQGDPLGSASANEWNPSAGTHLHFKVLLNDETVNPASYLGF